MEVVVAGTGTHIPTMQCPFCGTVLAYGSCGGGPRDLDKRVFVCEGFTAAAWMAPCGAVAVLATSASDITTDGAVALLPVAGVLLGDADLREEQLPKSKFNVSSVCDDCDKRGFDVVGFVVDVGDNQIDVVLAQGWRRGATPQSLS